LRTVRSRVCGRCTEQRQRVLSAVRPSLQVIVVRPGVVRQVLGMCDRLPRDTSAHIIGKILSENVAIPFNVSGGIYGCDSSRFPDRVQAGSYAFGFPRYSSQSKANVRFECCFNCSWIDSKSGCGRLRRPLLMLAVNEKGSFEPLVVPIFRQRPANIGRLGIPAKLNALSGGKPNGIPG